MSCLEVSEVRVELAHQHTQQAGSRANYKVEIVDLAGTKVSAARSIKGKPVAREFARRLKQAITSRGDRILETFREGFDAQARHLLRGDPRLGHLGVRATDHSDQAITGIVDNLDSKTRCTQSKF